MSDNEFARTELQIILDRARESNSKSLSLSGDELLTELDEIPDEVFALTELQELSLYRNSIRVIPERIRDLPKLKRLNVARNPIVRIPDVPGLAIDWDAYLRCRKTISRSHVEELWVDVEHVRPQDAPRAALPTLRAELRSMSNLRRLHIGLQSIGADTKLPEPTGQLRELIKNLDELPKLQLLSLFGLLLHQLPEAISRLRSLRTLSVHGAGLREIPDWLGELEHLRSLELGMNYLSDLPASLLASPNLSGSLSGKIYLPNSRR